MYFHYHPLFGCQLANQARQSHLRQNDWKTCHQYGTIGVLAIGLTACTVTVDEGNPPQRPRPPRPDICPRIYAPVCATRGGSFETFPNDCIAETRGYRVVYDGRCRIEPRVPRPPRPEVCSGEYRSVCGERNGVRRTFSSVFEGKPSGFRLLYDSVCSEIVDPTQPNT